MTTTIWAAHCLEPTLGQATEENQKTRDKVRVRVGGNLRIPARVAVRGEENPKIPAARVRGMEAARRSNSGAQ